MLAAVLMAKFLLGKTVFEYEASDAVDVSSSCDMYSDHSSSSASSKEESVHIGEVVDSNRIYYLNRPRWDFSKLDI